MIAKYEIYTFIPENVEHFKKIVKYINEWMKCSFEEIHLFLRKLNDYKENVDK